MILGMSTAAFTLLHVIISLIGIVSGIVVVGGMLGSRRLPAWTAVFLITTVLTSATGFLFHSKSFGPPHVLGVISLVVLLPTILALYLNAFVGVVQAFGKIGPLHALAPNGNELPFVTAQAVLLTLFVWIGAAALKRFPLRTGVAVCA